MDTGTAATNWPVFSVFLNCCNQLLQPVDFTQNPSMSTMDESYYTTVLFFTPSRIFPHEYEPFAPKGVACALFPQRSA
jgi:hypothetical protein